jgi:hypothetical protein
MVALLAHFAIIPVGFSPSFSSFLFRSFLPHFSVQIGGDSEDELLLMTEVESLQSQLKKNGETLNEKIENVFMESLIGKSTSVRIRRWTIRRDQLRKMAEAPHATSGGPAVSLDDTGTSLKADQHVEKAEEKQTKGAKRHGLENGGEQPRKRHKTPSELPLSLLHGTRFRFRAAGAAIAAYAGAPRLASLLPLPPSPPPPELLAYACSFGMVKGMFLK